jgi:hypothetical protein
MVIGTSRCAHVLCCLFSWRDGRRIRSLEETLCARPPLTFPVRRRCAALERKLAAGLLRWRTVERDATTHPAPAEYLPDQRSRHVCRSRSTQPPLGAVRRPTLVFGIRRRSAPVLRYVDAPRQKTRAGSRLSLPASDGWSEPPAAARARSPSRVQPPARDARPPGPASRRGCRCASR